MRQEFKNDGNAYLWEVFGFQGQKGYIIRPNKKVIESFDITAYQSHLLSTQPYLKDIYINRSDLKEETGEWSLHPDHVPKKISEGGEALILTQKFGQKEYAVRVHVFDPYLFTEKYDHKRVRHKIHLASGITLCYIK